MISVILVFYSWLHFHLFSKFSTSLWACVRLADWETGQLAVRLADLETQRKNSSELNLWTLLCIWGTYVVESYIYLLNIGSGGEVHHPTVLRSVNLIQASGQLHQRRVRDRVSDRVRVRVRNRVRDSDILSVKQLGGELLHQRPEYLCVCRTIISMFSRTARRTYRHYDAKM